MCEYVFHAHNDNIYSFTFLSLHYLTVYEHFPDALIIVLRPSSARFAVRLKNYIGNITLTVTICYRCLRQSVFAVI